MRAIRLPVEETNVTEDLATDDLATDELPADSSPTDDSPNETASADRAGGAAPTNSFAGLGLRPELVTALSGLGYEEPTPIQREAIPPLLDGRDLLGQAATGTGKTAAFALPILQRLDRLDRLDRRGRPEPTAGPTALVLVPTRELAVQVSEAIHRYGRDLGARVLPIYGGQPIVRQLRALEQGVDVVVATPGRALDHIGRRTLRLRELAMIVLDEADEMLDMGFADEIDSILAETPAGRQTVLFSATLPPRIAGIARRHLRDPVRIEIRAETAASPGAGPLVRQNAYVVQRAHKAAVLGRVLDVEAPAAALVFCRTRDEVDRLTETLNGRGYRAEALHGGMTQEQRDRVMGRLRAGTADLLVATDVAARGLDVEQLTHVINYDVPSSPDSYLHRIGRVGRAGREGVAITLVEPREHRILKTFERVTRLRISIEKVPTVADLRARRLELTRTAIRELVVDGDLDGFRVVVESLTDEFDVIEVALAAVKLAHNAAGAPADDEEIPDAVKPERKGVERKGVERKQSERTGTDRTGSDRTGSDRTGSDRTGSDRTGSDRTRSERDGPDGRDDHRRSPGGGMTRLFVGAGREAGVRPQDLVGAIAGETRLTGRDIGAIDIAPRFSLVEVPEDSADEVIATLRGTTIRGKRATVRREREPGRSPRRS